MTTGISPSPIGNNGLGANNISLDATEEEVWPEIADQSAYVANNPNTSTTTAFSGADYNSTLNVSPSNLNPYANGNTLVAQNYAANPPSRGGQAPNVERSAAPRDPYVAPPRTSKATGEIPGLTTYRENAGPWQNDDYKFGNEGGKVGPIGCTMTALLNASSISSASSVPRAGGAAESAVTPRDINLRNDKWEAARTGTNWNNLMNPANTSLGVPEKNRITLKQSDGQLTPAAKALLDKIDQQVRSGHPVVVGMAGQLIPGQQREGARHSIVVTGIDPSKGKYDLDRYIVRDNFKGNTGPNDPEAKRMTLEEALNAYGLPYTQIDMAIAASKK